MTTKNQCSVEGCAGLEVAKTFCDTHYRRWKKHGDPTITKERKRPVCSVPECGRPHAAHGFCPLHLHRWQKFGSTAAPPRGRRPRTVCTQCGKKAFAAKLCREHYSEMNVATAPPCTEGGCENPRIARGLCSTHYNNWRRYSGEFPQCPVPGCELSLTKGGLCDTHYKRLRRTGSLEANVGRSFAERQIFEFVKTIAPHAVQSSRSIIKPYELDIYIPKEA